MFIPDEATAAVATAHMTLHTYSCMYVRHALLSNAQHTHARTQYGHTTSRIHSFIIYMDQFIHSRR